MIIVHLNIELRLFLLGIDGLHHSTTPHILFIISMSEEYKGMGGNFICGVLEHAYRHHEAYLFSWLLCYLTCISKA